MDITPLFSTKLQKLWNLIELRVLVLLSLFLQFFLISTGNRRKYNNNKIMAALLWFCYLSADAVATLALGVLSQTESESENINAVDPKHTITVFWAPFLLMHLGGPDTITAYALADNELWSRHLLTLIGQVSVALYVFIRSFTPARLNFWWIVVFLAGTVKYGERIWVLYSASRNRYRDSMVSDPDPGPNYAKFVDEAVSREEEGYKAKPGEAFQHIQAPSSTGARRESNIPDTEVLEKANSYFRTFKKLFADLILSFQDREDSVSYFETLSAADAFLIVEIELGLVYDLFYTKSPLVFSRVGRGLRICSCSSAIATFVAFLTVKNGYPQTEVIITLILLVGAVFLEIYAIVVLSLSDPMMIKLRRGWAARPGEVKPPKYVSLLYRLRLVPARERWSNSIGQYNLFTHCLRYMPPKHTTVHWHSKLIGWCILKFRHKLDEYLFWKSKPVRDKLKEMIFDKVKRIEEAKGAHRKMDSYWIDRYLNETSCFDKDDEIEFDQSILVWHMATDICYYSTKALTEMSKEDKSKREICRLLSNYMVHLLMTSPFMLPSGIGQIRFQDTCAEATEFLDNETGLTEEGACNKLSGVDARFKPSEVKGDRSKSLLFDARRLSQYLEVLEVEERWKDISEAWLDMLTFAAAKCSWSDHAEKLSQGGELLTHVWLLMAHFGMTDHFQISKGYKRVKLELR